MFDPPAAKAIKPPPSPKRAPRAAVVLVAQLQEPCFFIPLLSSYCCLLLSRFLRLAQPPLSQVTFPSSTGEGHSSALFRLAEC